MPIYEYKCKDCSHQFDKLVFSSTQSAPIECPRCGEVRVARLFSTFGFIGRSRSTNSSNGGSACHSCVSKNCSSCHG